MLLRLVSIVGFFLVIYRFPLVFGNLSYGDFLSSSQEWSSWLVQHRRNLHRYPELMFAEYKTSNYILGVIETLIENQPQEIKNAVSVSKGWAVNIHYSYREDPNSPPNTRGKGGTGIVVDVGSGETPCVAIRADMDALPIIELTNVPFKSHIPGIMHACGHDSHMTMLLGALRLLLPLANKLRGTVRLIFQPAEEGGAGAKRMLEEGVLTRNPPVESIFGMHVNPNANSGVVSSKPDVFLAGVETFKFVVTGAGGHAAFPHLAIDPISAALSIGQGLYSMVSREFNSVSKKTSGLLSITTINGGDALNVIPDQISMSGTLRSLDTSALHRLRRRTNEVAEAISASHGCKLTSLFATDPYLPVINDKKLSDFFMKSVLEPSNLEFEEAEASMAGEDFGFFGSEVAAILVSLGTGGNPGADPAGSLDTSYGLHSPYFALDEKVLPIGSALHAFWVTQRLGAWGKLFKDAFDASSNKEEL